MGEKRRKLKSDALLHDRYRIEGEIGSGGFAITYRGRDTKTDVAVAIKELFPLGGSTDVAHEKVRFIREAKILREFDYLEGIVSVRDVFEERDTAYIVMDFIEGITLREYVKQYGTFSWDELVRMVTPIMKSLTKIHRRNVIHCDISPDNLMIGMDNRLCLIDFGATQSVSRNRDRTVILKQGFAPIEQYYSDGSAFDGRLGAWTDVYALAATMFMALTGEKPHNAVERLKADGRELADSRRMRDGKGGAGTVRKADAGEDSVQGGDLVYDERKLLEDILETWQTDALLKGMAVHKSERYAAMDEFLEAVTFAPEYMDDRTRVLYSGQPADRNQSQRNSTFYILTACLLLLLLSFGMSYLLRGIWMTDEQETSGIWTGSEGVGNDTTDGQMEADSEQSEKAKNASDSVGDRVTEGADNTSAGNSESGSSADTETGVQEREEGASVKNNGSGVPVGTEAQSKNSTAGNSGGTSTGGSTVDDDDELY